MEIKGAKHYTNLLSGNPKGSILNRLHEGVPYVLPKPKGYINYKTMHYNTDIFMQLKGGIFTQDQSKAVGPVADLYKKMEGRGSKIVKTLSDYGLGNMRVRDALGGAAYGLASDMAFPNKAELPFYHKIVAPDDELVKNKIIGKNKLINVKNLGVKEFWTKDPKTYQPPKPRKIKRVVLSWGGGHQGTAFLNPSMDSNKTLMNSILKGLDKKYGKGGYHLDVMAGSMKESGLKELTGTGARIEKYEKQYKGRVTFHPVLKKGYKQKILGADLQILAPGSTSAEMTAVKGYKPPSVAISLNPSDPRSAHFSENVKRMKPHMPTSEVIVETKAPMTRQFDKDFGSAIDRVEKKAKNWKYYDPNTGAITSKGWKGSPRAPQMNINDFVKEINKIHQARKPGELNRIGRVMTKGKLAVGAGLATLFATKLRHNERKSRVPGRKPGSRNKA